MNAVPLAEDRVIITTLEVADPTRKLILVPLSQLLPRRSKRNARTTARMSIPELAASIARVSLLQNLVVILAADGEHYEVVAGDRRLTALKVWPRTARSRPPPRRCANCNAHGAKDSRRVAPTCSPRCWQWSRANWCGCWPCALRPQWMW